MVNRNSEQERIYRIGLIVEVVSKCKEGADKNRLIAEFMCKYGISRRTMLEYIEALILTEKLEKKENKLFYKREELHGIL